MQNAELIAEKLLEIGAVKINLYEPYTWASGWKSPIYCDNRKLLSYPSVRDLVKTEMSSEIFQNYPESDMIAGVATAGIPHGALVADLLKLPFIYVRSKPKGHGLTNLIEGDISQGSKVVLVEDLVSTGGSSLKCVEALREAGLEPISLFCVFTYGFDEAKNNFASHDIPMQSLTDYNTMIEVALKKNLIQENQLETLKKWRESPSTWNV